LADVRDDEAACTHAPPRVSWVDYARGMGILLVVIGHTERGLTNAGILQPTPALQFCDDWIYAFHMPIFFTITGLFLHRSVSRSTRRFLLRRLRTIAYPYVLWCFLHGAVQALMAGHTNTEVSLSSLWRIVYRPPAHFWFLYVLFFCQVIYLIVHKLRLRPHWFLLLAMLLSLTRVAAMPLGPWGIPYLLRRYLVFVAVGNFVGASSQIERLGAVRSRFLIAGSLGGFAALTAGVSLSLHRSPGADLLIALTGSAAVGALAILLDRLRLIRLLQRWGVVSLEIYVAHVLFSAGFRIVLHHFLHVADPTVHFAAGCLAGLFGAHLLCLMAAKLRLSLLFRL